jgi:hypothetical protein
MENIGSVLDHERFPCEFENVSNTYLPFDYANTVKRCLQVFPKHPFQHVDDKDPKWKVFHDPKLLDKIVCYMDDVNDYESMRYMSAWTFDYLRPIFYILKQTDTVLRPMEIKIKEKWFRKISECDKEIKLRLIDTTNEYCLDTFKKGPLYFSVAYVEGRSRMVELKGYKTYLRWLRTEKSKKYLKYSKICATAQRFTKCDHIRFDRIKYALQNFLEFRHLWSKRRPIISSFTKPMSILPWYSSSLTSIKSSYIIYQFDNLKSQLKSIYPEYPFQQTNQQEPLWQVFHNPLLLEKILEYCNDLNAYENVRYLSSWTFDYLRPIDKIIKVLPRPFNTPAIDNTKYLVRNFERRIIKNWLYSLSAERWKNLIIQNDSMRDEFLPKDMMSAYRIDVDNYTIEFFTTYAAFRNNMVARQGYQAYLNWLESDTGREVSKYSQITMTRTTIEQSKNTFFSYYSDRYVAGRDHKAISHLKRIREFGFDYMGNLYYYFDHPSLKKQH